MLLSLPTWLIHILTISEWFTAMLLFYRDGHRIQRLELKRFALCVIPHLFGGLCIYRRPPETRSHQSRWEQACVNRTH